MAETGLPPIAELTGPLFLGFLFNWALFGALSVQVYLYYLAFPKDRMFPTKSLVIFVYVYEVIQTLLITRDGFNYFGSGWGDLNELGKVGWVWITVPLMTGLISALTQIFYAWRIYLLSRQPYIPIFITMIAFLVAAGGIWSAVIAYRVGIWSEVQVKSSTSATVWLGGTAICDVAIAAAMLYYLSRSRGGFRQTNTLLVKLIRITIETGFITAAVAVVDLATFLAFKKVNYHLTPAIALSKLYSNSLMALLNSRIRISGGRSTGAPAYDVTLAQNSWSAQIDRTTNGATFGMTTVDSVSEAGHVHVAPTDGKQGVHITKTINSTISPALQWTDGPDSTPFNDRKLPGNDYSY